MTSASTNIARHLPAMARRQPQRAALKIPRGRDPREGTIDYLTLSFADLDAEVNAWVQKLTDHGVRRGDRVLVMVKQGLPLIASVFALFKTGAVPVVIDPGMGLRSFLRCVGHSRPRVLLGIPLARLISRMARSAFTTVEVRVTASSRATQRLLSPGTASPLAKDPTVETHADELAAILFTSGSTGAPKGVCYTHGMFDAQVQGIRQTYDIQPGEIDLPLLPIFALFNPALGMTTIVPEIDPRRPAAMDPAKIVQALLQENVTTSFGSPTLWRKIGDFAQDHGVVFPKLKRVLCAGAPVPPSLWTASTLFLPSGQLHSPYGATEALPVSTISTGEVLAETATATRRGAGTCVGRAISGVEIRILPISDEPIAKWEETFVLPTGEIGEIVVRGAAVTRTYDALPEATARAKITVEAKGNVRGGASEAGAVWHRMGDCGYLDRQGRLWFCGRKVERVVMATGTLFTEQVEPIFNQHPRVKRSALVGVGASGEQRPWVIIELKPDSRPSDALKAEILNWAREQPHDVNLSRLEGLLFHPSFPVDVRHNAKIHRLTLAKWAAKQAK